MSAVRLFEQELLLSWVHYKLIQSYHRLPNPPSCHQKIDELESKCDRLKRELESTETNREEAHDEIPLDIDDTLRSLETEDMDDLRGLLSAMVVAEGAERARKEVDQSSSSNLHAYQNRRTVYESPPSYVR
ncbi:hypothetical protein RYH80_19300 [Halobaculum sp. MBLA0147]|uniref:hypothetical protein n=1 Tax=Halobaculum sp. MBLA0147 TaxID=3079934 RepID=UPI00352663CC